MKELIRRALVVTGLIDHLQPLLLLAARLYVSLIFFRSGMLKLADWSSTLALFRDTYHYSTYISTAQALRALALCGELPPLAN